MTYNKSIRTHVLLAEFTGQLREMGGLRQAYDEVNCRLSQLCESALKLYKGRNIHRTLTRPLRATSGQWTISW